MDSYTENDFNSLYQTVRRELIQKANYDIQKDNKYRTMLVDVVTNLRKKKSGSPQYLNSISSKSILKFCTHLFLKGVKTENGLSCPVLKKPGS